MSLNPLVIGPSSIGVSQIGFRVLCLAALLSSLDSSVNVAFPLIINDFNIEVAEIKWIIISYILAVASLTIVFGRLGDLFGHKRVFVTGNALSIVAYASCALAPNYDMLVGFRFLQGIATGLSLSCVVALMTAGVPDQKKRQIVGIFVTVVGIGMALGPMIGGILIDIFGWPSVFWYRSIIAIVVLLFSCSLSASQMEQTNRNVFDWLGGLILFTLIASVILLSVLITRPHVSPILLVALLAFILACGWLFSKYERFHESPIIDVRFFSNRYFSLLQFAAVVINFCCFSVLLLMPIVLSTSYSISNFSSGIMLALMPIGMVAAGWMIRRIPRLVSSDNLSKIGLFIAAFGLLALGIFDGFVVIGLSSISLLIVGLGLGLFKTGCVDTTTTLLPSSQRGVSGSLYNVTQVLGFVLGASFITAMATLFGGSGIDGSEYGLTFATLGVGLLMFAGIYSLLIARITRSTP